MAPADHTHARHSWWIQRLHDPWVANSSSATLPDPHAPHARHEALPALPVHASNDAVLLMNIQCDIPSRTSCISIFIHARLSLGLKVGAWISRRASGRC